MLAVDRITAPACSATTSPNGSARTVTLSDSGGARSAAARITPSHRSSIPTRLQSLRRRSVPPQRRSMMVAVPIPPPVHIVMSAVDRSRRSSSSSAVWMSIPPVAPIG